MVGETFDIYRRRYTRIAYLGPYGVTEHFANFVWVQNIRSGNCVYSTNSDVSPQFDFGVIAGNLYRLIASNSGTLSPTTSPPSDANGYGKQERFDASGEYLAIGPVRSFLRRLSHAPLLAQIGFIGILGGVTGVPIIFGIGLGQGSIGADRRGSRRLDWCLFGFGLSVSGVLIAALGFLG